MRLLGIVHAFNEEDCIGHALDCLLEAEHDQVVAFDHGSTDGTPDVLASYGSRISVIRIERKQKSFPALFGTISHYIRARHDDFDWVTWIDADEILRPPQGSALTRTHLEVELKRGTQVIRPLLCEFWLSTVDPPEPEVPDYLQRVRRYRKRPGPSCPRGWKPALTGRMPQGRHRHAREWPKGTIISNNRWFLHHYPVRSLEQGKRKIMQERQWGPEHYRRYRRERCANLVRPPKELPCLA